MSSIHASPRVIGAEGIVRAGGERGVVGVDLADAEDARRGAAVALLLVPAGFVLTEHAAAPDEAVLAVEHRPRGGATAFQPSPARSKSWSWPVGGIPAGRDADDELLHAGIEPGAAAPAPSSARARRRAQTRACWRGFCFSSSRILKNLPRTVAVVLIIAATFLVYWPALRNGFVWDDTALVLRDPLIRSWRLIPEGFRHFLFLDATASNFYRPIQRLTLRRGLRAVRLRRAGRLAFHEHPRSTRARRWRCSFSRRSCSRWRRRG